MIRFVLAMTWREARASWRRLILFALCVAAGVGGLVAVQSFADTLERAIRSEARTLLAADLALHSGYPFTAGERAAAAALAARGAQVVRSAEFLSMAQAPGGQVLLVDARSVSAGYPLYGEVLLNPPGPLSRALTDDTVAVQSGLLYGLGLKLGDPLKLGRKTFRIAAELVKEPDSPVTMANVAPRVLMTEAGGEATGLITASSRIRFGLLIRLPPGADVKAEAAALKQAVSGGSARVVTYDQAQPAVSRFLSQLTRYLNLIGLISLLLGGIGIAGALRAFIAQRMDSIAVLKCLGATGGLIFAMYLAQAALLGVAGSLGGAVLGTATQWILARLLADLLPVSVGFGVSPLALGKGLLLGTATTLWFALPPLWQVRGIAPARILRRAVETAAPVAPWRRVRVWLAGVVAGGVLMGGLAYLEVKALDVAAIFGVGLTATVLALLAAAQALLALLRRLPKPRGFALRQGLSGLYRPGNQSAPVMVALGLATFLLLAVVLIQKDLLRQVTLGSAPDQPTLYFIDIQPDQRKDFQEILKSHGLPPAEILPVVRGRVYALNGRRVAVDALPEGERKRILSYEFPFTYRGTLQPGEQVLEGRFGPDPDVQGAQVSVADWWMKALGMKLGDTVTLDIEGVRIPATITSIRQVDWANRRANFSFVFMPGALEKAPQIFYAAVAVPDAAARAALQRALVKRLPNVTGIDVSVVMKLVQQLLDRIAVVIQFMAVFSVAVGLVILLGAIATTKYQRLREAVLLKTLGATRGAVARVMAVEYGVLGGLSAGVGAVAAGGLSWGLVTRVFEGRWDLSVPVYAAGWALATAAIVATGLASSVDILMKKPLAVLREE
ncbi:MAG: ABC transporter permease [SAR324 cluster bacterium]